MSKKSDGKGGGAIKSVVLAASALAAVGTAYYVKKKKEQVTVVEQQRLDKRRKSTVISKKASAQEQRDIISGRIVSAQNINNQLPKKQPIKATVTYPSSIQKAVQPSEKLSAANIPYDKSTVQEGMFEEFAPVEIDEAVKTTDNDRFAKTDLSEQSEQFQSAAEIDDNEDDIDSSFTEMFGDESAIASKNELESSSDNQTKSLIDSLSMALNELQSDDEQYTDLSQPQEDFTEETLQDNEQVLPQFENVLEHFNKLLDIPEPAVHSSELEGEVHVPVKDELPAEVLIAAENLAEEIAVIEKPQEPSNSEDVKEEKQEEQKPLPEINEEAFYGLAESEENIVEETNNVQFQRFYQPEELDIASDNHNDSDNDVDFDIDNQPIVETEINTELDSEPEQKPAAEIITETTDISEQVKSELPHIETENFIAPPLAIIKEETIEQLPTIAYCQPVIITENNISPTLEITKAAIEIEKTATINYTAPILFTETIVDAPREIVQEENLVATDVSLSEISMFEDEFEETPPVTAETAMQIAQQDLDLPPILDVPTPTAEISDGTRFMDFFDVADEDFENENINANIDIDKTAVHSITYQKADALNEQTASINDLFGDIAVDDDIKASAQQLINKINDDMHEISVKTAPPPAIDSVEKEIVPRNGIFDIFEKQPDMADDFDNYKDERIQDEFEKKRTTDTRRKIGADIARDINIFAPVLEPLYLVKENRIKAKSGILFDWEMRVQNLPQATELNNYWRRKFNCYEVWTDEHYIKMTTDLLSIMELVGIVRDSRKELIFDEETTEFYLPKSQIELNSFKNGDVAVIEQPCWRHYDKCIAKGTMSRKAPFVEFSRKKVSLLEQILAGHLCEDGDYNLPVTADNFYGYDRDIPYVKESIRTGVCKAAVRRMEDGTAIAFFYEILHQDTQANVESTIRFEAKIDKSGNIVGKFEGEKI